MGTGFTIDTPLKVAPLGISSVVSLVDDQLIEKMYKKYTTANGMPYREIRKNKRYARPLRITRYLNLLKTLVDTQFEQIREQKFSPENVITRYFELLPCDSKLYQEYTAMQQEEESSNLAVRQNRLRKKMLAGSIDVNIMTKVDRPQYKNGEINTSELSDALAALKGFAESDLESAVVFSAGVNTKLFQALTEYDDFFTEANALPRKRIILKVSDFRSALTQGKMLAKKGIWVSEFRIESGLNCGGHAFPTKGELMAITLEEFRVRREELIDTLFTLYAKATTDRAGWMPEAPLPVRFSAQGGVGTHEEHEFLRHYFKLDSIGWGSPFLLVPEATVVDEETRAELLKAKATDIYLSNSSPLGVPFYTLLTSKSEQERKRRIAEKKPGSPCFNKYLASNTEFEGEPLCVASKAYQQQKITSLESSDLLVEEIEQQKASLLEKACICFELGASPRMKGNSEVSESALYPAICPGPNIVYFEGCYSLKEMVDHIYGKTSTVRLDTLRPHVLLNELKLYIEYSQRFAQTANASQQSYWNAYRENLVLGLKRYEEFSKEMNGDDNDKSQKFLGQCATLHDQLVRIQQSVWAEEAVKSE